MRPFLSLATLAILLLGLVLSGCSKIDKGVNSDIKNISNKPSPIKPVSNDSSIQIKAEMWEYSPNIIRLKKGQPVTINLNNIDFAHGIAIPDLELGGMETLTFTPEEAGEFEFFCPTYCGSGHGNMRGKIIVE